MEHGKHHSEKGWWNMIIKLLMQKHDYKVSVCVLFTLLVFWLLDVVLAE